MTDQEQQAQLQAMQAMIAGLADKMQAQSAQPQPAKPTGYGDAQAQQPATSDLIRVVLPFSCQRAGKWLNWTEEYMIPDGADAFNALLDRIEARGKPLSLRGATAAGGGYGKK